MLALLNFYERFLFKREFANRDWKKVKDTQWFGELNVVKAKFYRQQKTTAKVHPVQTQHIHNYGFDFLESIVGSPDVKKCSDLYKRLYNEEELHGDPDDKEHSYIIDDTKLSSFFNMKSMYDGLGRHNGDGMNQNPKNSMLLLFLKGFSRRINIFDDQDWEKLKMQLVKNDEAARFDYRGFLNSDEVARSNFDLVKSNDLARQKKPPLYIAVSYKHKNETFTWKVRMMNAGQREHADAEGEVKFERSKDMLFDERWDQLKRCTRELGRKEDKHTASLWLDRLVFLNDNQSARDEHLNEVDWSSFGLWPYIVCNVVRLYRCNEKEYSNDFWRKIELYLGINGKGVITDDYMVNTYDDTFNYGEEAVRWYQGGTLMIGGNNMYLRSTVLALASAVLDDGIAITKSNEHPETKKSISIWKKWAIWNICQNMYGLGPITPRLVKRVDVGLLEFQRIVTLTAVTRNMTLIKNTCPINFAAVKTTQQINISNWDGINEWIGFDQKAYSIEPENRKRILEYLDEIAKIEPYIANTGHRATAITLCSQEYENMNKGIVVETSRYSTLSKGNVISIYSFTNETSGKRLFPQYESIINPDKQQVEAISSKGWEVKYKRCVYISIIEKWIIAILSIIFGLAISTGGITAIFGIPLFLFGVYLITPNIKMKSIWWCDKQFIGEGITDNIILHKTYGSGIKSKYNKLGGEIKYSAITWSQFTDIEPQTECGPSFQNRSVENV